MLKYKVTYEFIVADSQHLNELLKSISQNLFFNFGKQYDIKPEILCLPIEKDNQIEYKCKHCKYCYYEELDGKLSCWKGIQRIYDICIETGEYIENDDICNYFELKGDLNE